MISIKRISKTKRIKTDRTIYIPTESEKTIYAEIDREIKRKYNIRLHSRDTIIQSIISILTQGDYNRVEIPNIDFTIIRSDIQNFFPSINKHKLYQKISKSNILKSKSQDILKSLFFSNKIKGVPLGFPFSNSLAEIFLETFDEDIIFEIDPLFYFRYVDDIILIKYLDKSHTEDWYRKKVSNIARKYDLTINERKTFVSNWTNNQNSYFEYLGYSFLNNDYRLFVDIADEKYKKLEKTIKSYFYQYRIGVKSKRDFWILYYRLKNRIYGITSDTEKNLKYGMGFSYKYVNSEDYLDKLVKFMTYQIINLRLSSFQRNTLFSLIVFKKNKLDILKKRLNYNRLTHNQLNKICNRLGILTIKHSSKTYKIKNIFRVLQ